MKREKYISKAIICSLLTASVISISGSVMAAENDGNVEYSNMIYMQEGESIRENENFNVTPQDQEAAGDNGISVIQIKNQGTKLTVNNSKIAGGSVSVRNGASMIINNSTIEDGQYWTNNKPNGGTDFKTEGGTLVVNDSTIKSTILSAESDDGKHTKGSMTLNNTNIESGLYGDGSIVSDYNSELILNGGKDTTYKTLSFIGSFNDENFQNPGRIEINGGTLVADNLRSLTNGSLVTPMDGDEMPPNWKENIVKGGIVLQNDGVIRTKTGEIFAKGIDTTNDETVKQSKDSGAVTNDYIKYNGGTLEFTDSKYTDAYLDSAVENMKNAGTTSIAMLGQLLDENNKPKDSITIEEAVNKGSGVYQDLTTVKADDSVHTLSINGSSGTADGVQSADSFNAAVLELGKDTKIVNVENGRQLGLGSSYGGDMITGTSTDGLTVNVDSASLNLNRNGVGADTASMLNADINAANGAEINSLGGINTVKGDVAISNAQLNVSGNSTLKVDGSLTGSEESEIIIGSDDESNDKNNSAGTLISGDTALYGATVFLDPVWKDGQDISDGSKAALVFGKNKVDGDIVVGENSVLSLGTEDTTKVEKAFAKTGEKWGTDGVLSAVYVEGSHDVEAGVLIADPKADADYAKDVSTGTVKFGNNSMLIVDGSKITGDAAALTGIADVQFATASEEGKSDNAKLYINNADKGTYNIFSAAAGSSLTENAVAADSILSNSDLLKFSSSDADGRVTAAYQDVDKVYTGKNSIIIAESVDSTLQNDKIKSGNAAYDFFRSASNKQINATTEAQADAFNSAANLSELGGVNHATYSMSNIMTDSVTDHLSLANHEYNSHDIWAKYIHSKEDIDSMELGGLSADYDANFNGITVGGDFYNKGKGTIGAAFSYAKGDIDGYTLSSRTENDADYYGFSLYGRIDNGDSALLGDISYLHGSNDIKQYNSGTEITASPDSDAFSIGIRAEKLFKAGENGKIVPYAGLRYMHLGTGSYTNNIGMNYDASDQNLLLIPVGVKFSTEIEQNDWVIRPYAEAGYVWTAGDRETDQTVSLNGGMDTFDFETADKGSFVGKLGVQAESDKMAYGLGYEYQNGDTTSADRWMANLTFKF